MSNTNASRDFGHSPDVGTVAEETHRQQIKGAGITVSSAEKTNGNRDSLPRTGPMRGEIGVSRAALRSGCKPRKN